MRLFRTLTTPRLLGLLVAVAAVAISAGAVAVTAFGGGGATPVAKPLAQALHDALAAAQPEGISARVTFTNNLLPSSAIFGQAGSALMSGASGRLWAMADGHGRIELQSDAGDTQIVWNAKTATVYDSSSNTVYRFTLPAKATTTTTTDTKWPPSLDEISSWLDRLGADAAVSDAQPGNIAGQPAYTVTVSPKHDSGLLGSAELAWEAARGVPLRIALYARGSGTPVLALTATEISYGPVSASEVDVTPPAGATVVDVGSGAPGNGNTGATETSGIDAVQAAVSFPLVAPESLVGLPRQTVRLLDSDTKGALIVYGEGLNSVILVERPLDGGKTAGKLDSLPKVAIADVTGHELATPLGTAIEFQRAGVSFILAASLSPATAEAAASAALR